MGLLRHFHALSLAAALAIATPMHAAAVILVSNLDQPPVAVPTTIPDDAGWAAQSFVTDTASYTLTSIEIVLGATVGNPTVVAELRAGGALSVGASLGSFALPTLTSGNPVNVVLTPTSPIALAPSSAYWLVIGLAGAGSIDWTYASTNTITGSGSLGNYAYSPDNGATWGAFSEVRPYLMAVEVAPVPIPAQGWLVAVGLGAMLSLRRRPRRTPK